MKDKIKLSIILQTYNHEKYIAQVLESILMQRVDFDYELIVCEDCSTDRSRDIILRYADKFKNIKLCFNKENYGVLFTFMMSKYNCSDTKYIAILEGDDYWTDPDKLQQQVDFLDKNEDFVGCSHNTEAFYEKEQRRANFYKDGQIKSVNELVDIIDGKFYAHTSSYVWRNIFKKEYPKAMSYNQILMGDWFLSMLYAKHGKIKYIDKVMSCYRVTGNGIWSKLSKYQQEFDMLRAAYVYNKLLNSEHKFTGIFEKCIWFLRLHSEKLSISLKIKAFLLALASYRIDQKELDIKIVRKLSKIQLFNKLNQYIPFLKLIPKITWLISIICEFLFNICEFLFNALFLFDINRYYIYYKIKIYRFFKIKIYKDLGH